MMIYFITSLNTLISLTPSILFKSGVSKTINNALGKISSDTLSTAPIYLNLDAAAPIV